MAGDGLEKSEAEQAGGHGHGAYPACLQPKIHIGKAYNQAYHEADEKASDGKAASLYRSWKPGRFGVGFWGLRVDRR